MAVQIFSNTLKRWQLIALVVGVIASLITIIRFGLPPVIDLAMQGRDREISELKSEVTELRKVMAQSVDATQRRFEMNEKHTGYLREAVAGIRAELRVRFRSSDQLSRRTDRAMNSSAKALETEQLPDLPTISTSKPKPASSDELERLAAKTDQSVEQTIKSAPKGRPLEDIKVF